jgi:hypothetical protein
VNPRQSSDWLKCKAASNNSKPRPPQTVALPHSKAKLDPSKLN